MLEIDLVRSYNIDMRRMALTLVIILACFLTSCSNAAPNINTYYCKSDYTPYVLTNNPLARDVSYRELLTCLNTFKPEVLPSKTCGYYAEELHKYSESEGIRCAIVIANNHAFDGFRLNGDMIYVDAENGIISFVVGNNEDLRFVKKIGTYIQVQNVGRESDFSIFWGGMK